jgi:SAM-dependent methyltransferase
MKQIRKCSTKSHVELAREWDQLAPERHRQIVSGEDLSFDNVVVPLTWRLFDGADPTVVLDIGSGTGDFTVRLAEHVRTVIAIEPSRVSMTLARLVCGDAQNVRYIEAPLEEAASVIDERAVTAAVAVMTLMTAPDLRGFAKALALLLRKGARFVATLTHPCFWPRYWGYEKEPWFSYGAETFIEAPFTTSKGSTGVRTTHIHRPLEQYVRVFAEEGFCLDALAEPMPGPEVQVLYPRPWEFPRFLGLRWERAG